MGEERYFQSLVLVSPVLVTHKPHRAKVPGVDGEHAQTVDVDGSHHRSGSRDNRDTPPAELRAAAILSLAK